MFLLNVFFFIYGSLHFLQWGCSYIVNLDLLITVLLFVAIDSLEGAPE